MRRYLTLMAYAVDDLSADGFITAVTVMLFTVILTPLVLLYVVKFGVITAWTDDLSRDTFNREVLISGERGVTGGELADIAAWPETGFVVPEPSNLVSTTDWRLVDPVRGDYVDIDWRTTQEGDPVFTGVVPKSIAEVALSFEAARVLRGKLLDRIKTGDKVQLVLRRMPASGGSEIRRVVLTVVAVLPESQWPAQTAFVSPELGKLIRSWQWFELDEWSMSISALSEDTYWESIRIYAISIHEAPALRDRLREMGFDTELRTDQIEDLKAMEHGLNLIFGVVVLLSTAAFAAGAFLLQWLGVARKRRDFALLVALGFSRRMVGFMPVIQSLLITLASAILAVLLLFLSVPFLGSLAQQFTQTAEFRLPPVAHFCVGLLIALVMGVVGSVGAVSRITGLDITSAIRSD